MRVALCPSRTITDVEEAQRDAHLRHRYAVCLEAYVLGYSVRALPCFHTFHTRCIDVWVFAKGLCPIDKYLCSYTYMFKFHGLNVKARWTSTTTTSKYDIASAPSYVELMYKVGDRWMIGQHTFQQKPPLHRLLPFACLRNTLHDTIHRLPHIHLF